MPGPSLLERHRHLLLELGGRCHPEPVPVALPGHEIGQLGLVPVISLAGPPATALSLARRLARGGAAALLVADDAATHRCTMAVSLLPVRAAVFDRREARPLVLERLRHRRPGGGALGEAIACAGALDADVAGRRAFGRLRRAITGAVDALPGNIRGDRRHAWVLLQVTRLLFLRFVESEGWLDGRDTFLRDLFDACLRAGQHPERHLLEPLFFGTLNRPPSARSATALAFGRIPFLNGGLFEPHLLERRHRWQLPIDMWLELTELVIEGIEVSLEPDPRRDLVTPELIGRVFEGVMDPGERRQSGTYFTPPALVDVVAREAIAAHLSTRLGRDCAEIIATLGAPDAELRRALRRIRVLDPAVGSGAFLVGSLSVLAWPGPGRATRVRRAVTTALFGVDRNPGAVRIAELRLWLEVLRSLRGRRIARLPPLPSLDRMLRVGDALLDPLAGERLPPSMLASLAEESRKVADLHGVPRRRALARLRRLERTAAGLALDAREGRIDHLLAETLDHQRRPTLFGDRPEATPVVRRRVQDLRVAARQVRRERRRLERGETTPSFALESAWPAAMRSGGFDVVIGNPPWVRAERLEPGHRDLLRARYRWWRPSGRGWKHLPDLSVAFVERGLEVLARGGTLALLVPSKLSTAGYATRMRQALAGTTTLHCVADVSTDPRAGFDATTYPMVVITHKADTPADHRVRLGLTDDSPSLPQALWHGQVAWPLGDASLIALADRVRRAHPTLGDTLQPGLGVKTGANRVFLNPPGDLVAWTRPALRGRDISRFRIDLTDRLLWPADDLGVPLATLPSPVHRYLTRHREALRRRADCVTGPWWRLFRTELACARWRVAWADLARELTATALPDHSVIPLNSCYLVATATADAMYALTAWCNARPIGALARLSADRAANGYARFSARVVDGLPLPECILDDPVLTELGRRGASSSPTELDRHVSDRLGITAGEAEDLHGILTTGR